MTIAATIHAVASHERGRRLTAAYVHLKCKCQEIRRVLAGETVSGVSLADLGEPKAVHAMLCKLMRQLWRTPKFED